jgi:hypothetical protein
VFEDVGDAGYRRLSDHVLLEQPAVGQAFEHVGELVLEVPLADEHLEPDLVEM